MEASEVQTLQGLLRVYFLIVDQLELPDSKNKEMLDHLKQRINDILGVSVKTSGLSYEEQERNDGH